MPKGSTHRNNIRVGQETGLNTTRTIGAVQLFQKAVVSANASVGAFMFNLPASADISHWEAHVGSAMNAEVSLRLGAVAGSASNRYGAVTLSGVGVYRVENPSTALTWAIGASSQPIGYTCTATSGADTPAVNNVTVRLVYGVDYRTFDT